MTHFDKRIKGLLMTGGDQAPPSHAEIDHTTLDIIVVDRSSNLPLGRPILTVIIDTNTRRVVGYTVGGSERKYPGASPKE